MITNQTKALLDFKDQYRRRAVFFKITFLNIDSVREEGYVIYNILADEGYKPEYTISISFIYYTDTYKYIKYLN